MGAGELLCWGPWPWKVFHKELRPDDEWKRGAVLILALNHQKVGEIDARRFEFDADHSRRKGRVRQS